MVHPTVTYTAVDRCGNTMECSFDVTLLDKEAPVLNITGVEGNDEWFMLEGDFGYWDAMQYSSVIRMILR